ncbi:MAG TPA: ATP-binding protein [Pyrinomonadaceae bacterium]|nr:ATP-binding protein [Pyrinomonadaceae bacterium]
MSDRWTPTNILNLFLPATGESAGAPISAEISRSLTELFESGDLENVTDVSTQISEYVQQYTSVLTTAFAETQTVSPLRRAYRRSASVLTAFDPGNIKPVGETAEPGDAAKELVDDIVEVYDPPTVKQRWMLEPTIRAGVLREFGTQQELIAALEANPTGRPETVVQKALELYINQDPVPIFELLPQEQLAAHLQAVRWLESTSLNLPSTGAIQDAIDQREVPAVFSKMAGNNFVGREEELALLRDYVEVLPASTNLRGIQRQVRRWLGLQRKPPLVIYGPGGVGKTTLISRFLLDHMNVPEEFKFPYVYLDFDNPRVSAGHSDSILTEAVRQLSIQYPNARTKFKEFLAVERGSQAFDAPDSSDAILEYSGPAQEAQAADSLSRFAQLVNSIVNRFNNQEGIYSLPLLIVLDTYEEVQYRGLRNEIKLWNLLDAIGSQFPTLRLVIFGRAPLDQLPTTSTQTTVQALSEFKRDSAVLFLKKLGIGDSGVAGELFDSVGGNPLSLKLAAEIYSREGAKTDLVKRDWVRSLFFFKASELLVQGQLYQRILNHIHDPDVRKLAHPGLVLRRITAELIQKVLAVPCGIDVPNDERARELFEALGREVALVMPESDGSLVHRADLRPKMLEFIERDKPVQAEEISTLAVEYYLNKTRLEDRAEEIYHRLKLKQPASVVQARWISGVEQFLRNVLPELPVESRPILGSLLGISVSGADLQAADLAVWEGYTARSADELIKLGHNEDALKKLSGRTERTKGSPLYRIEARALASLKRLKEAEGAVQKALKAAAASGRRTELLDCVFLAAEISQQLKSKKRADEYLKQAFEIATGLNDRTKQILALLHRLRLRSNKKQHDPDSEAAGLIVELAALLGALPEIEWVSNKQLVRASVSMLGPDYADFFVRMIRRVGIGTLDPKQLSILADGLAKLQKSTPVEQLTRNFAKTVGLTRTAAVSEIVPALQSSTRLDEFLEKLVPAMLDTPGLAKQMWSRFGSLFEQTNIQET